jgi:hypothetical protein
MFDSAAIRTLISRAILERDEITRALQADQNNAELQRQRAAWHKGQLEGWMPVGEAGKLLAEWLPRRGLGRFDKSLRAANESALNSPAAVLLISKLERAKKAHRALLDEACGTVKNPHTQLLTLEEHRHAFAELADVVNDCDHPGGENLESLTETIAIVADPAAAVLLIAHSSQSVNDRMSQILKLDTRFAAKSCNEWAMLLQCTDGCIRQTVAWQSIQDASKATAESSTS